MILTVKYCKNAKVKRLG